MMLGLWFLLFDKNNHTWHDRRHPWSSAPLGSAAQTVVTSHSKPLGLTVVSPILWGQ